MPDAPLVPATREATPPVARSSRRGRIGRVSLRVPVPLLEALKAFSGDDLSSSLAGLASGPLSSIVPGGIGDTEEIRDPYLQEGWFGACVDLRTIAVALATPRIWDRDPNNPKAEQVTEGPAYDLLQAANPLMGALRLRVQDALNMDLGNESIHLLQDGEGNPVRGMGDGPDALIDWPERLVPVRGSLLRLKLNDVTGLPSRWKYRTRRGENKEWPASAAVQYGLIPDPNRAHRFLGPIAKIIGPANMRYLAMRYQSFLMRNDGSAGGWMELDGPMPGREEADRTREEMAEEWDSIENAGATKAVWGGKFHETGVSPKNLAWPELHELAKKDISAIMGTPMALLGEGSSNFATFAGEWMRFTKLTLKQWFLLYEATWNRSLFARQRDPTLREYRLRFDTEVLDTLFADADAQSQVADRYSAMGVPLDEALRQAGIKTDPIDGGDVPMLRSGRITLAAAQLQGQAKAVKAAIAAKMDPAQAWERAGVSDVRLVEPPAPEPEPKGDPPPATEPKALAAPQTAPTAPVTRMLSEAVRAAARKRLAKVTAKHRKDMAAAIRKIFRQMGVAQKKAFEQFAEDGQVDRAGEVAAIYRGAPPAFERAVAASFMAAYETDREAGTRTVQEVTCSGRVLREVEAEVWDMRLTWQRVHGPAGVPLQRCQDLILLERATLTESQIDSLIVLTDARWIDALTEKVWPLSVQAYESAARDLSQELGIAIRIDVTDPDWLAAMKDHAVQVVEGTDSVLAARMRSDIISVLADYPTLPSLQELIRESLGDLKASTTRAFKDHHARALAIARTETGRAASRARADELLEAFQDGVVSAKEWFTSGRSEEPEGTVRSAHFAMDGVRTQPGVPYIVDGVSMQHPLDPNAPARLVVNCECGETGVVDEDE